MVDNYLLLSVKSGFNFSNKKSQDLEYSLEKTVYLLDYTDKKVDKSPEFKVN